MLFSFDAIVASLVFVLPGFLVAGTVVAVAPAWERFNPNPATYVLLSLGASIPLHLAFAWLATLEWKTSIQPWFRPFDSFDFTDISNLAFAGAFLKPAFSLLALSVLLGFAVVGLMWGIRRVSRRGRSVPSQKTVWRRVFEPRTKAPNVIVFMNGRAYRGQPRKVTTTTADPHLFLEDVSAVPIDPETHLPVWDRQQPLAMEGLLIQQGEIQEMWFLND